MEKIIEEEEVKTKLFIPEFPIVEDFYVLLKGKWSCSIEFNIFAKINIHDRRAPQEFNIIALHCFSLGVYGYTGKRDHSGGILYCLVQNGYSYFVNMDL